jgi:hypothetical protein
MATHALRRRAATAPAVPEPLPIGQEEQQIFNCPVCSRPLATGARRCSGCQTRLIRGVPALKANLFIATGLVVGLFVGGGAVAGYGALTPHVTTPRPAGAGALPTTAPGAGGGTSGAIPSAGSGGSSGTGGSGSGAAPALSAIASSSLQQAADVNVKLAEGSLALRVALDESRFDTADAAMILRSIASNAQFGADLAPKIGTWEPGADLSADLAAFYETVRETARMGLGSSLANTQGYRQAATDMIRTLRGLRALQSSATKLGATVSITLPPLPTPAP